MRDGVDNSLVGGCGGLARLGVAVVGGSQVSRCPERAALADTKVVDGQPVRRGGAAPGAC